MSAAAAAPPAGPLRTVSAAWLGGELDVGEAAARLHDRRAPAGPRSRAAVDEPAQVAARAAGRGRRRPRSSPRARTRGTSRRPRARARRGRRAARRAQRRADRALVLGEAVGVQQADRDRLGARARRRRATTARAPSPSSALEHAVAAPMRSGAATRRSGGTSGAGCARAQAVEVLARLAAELDDVGEALGGDERGARAAALEQRVGRDGHPVRERRRRRRRSRPARSSAARDGVEHARATGRPASSAPSR